MDKVKTQEATALLRRFAGGDSEVQERLYQAVCAELRIVAQGMMSEQPKSHTLQPTALVHEAWIRLVAGAERSFENRRHFLGVASKAMRTVLVDHVRSKRSLKRGGHVDVHPLDEAVAELEVGDTDLLDLEAALQELERDDPELARAVEMRFFGGLSHPDIATTLGVSLSTVERNWRIARARLHRALAPGGGEA